MKAADYREDFERAMEGFVESSESLLVTVTAKDLFVYIKKHPEDFSGVPVDEPGFPRLLGWFLSERFGKLFDGEVIYDKLRPKATPNGGQRYVVIPAAMVFGSPPSHKRD